MTYSYVDSRILRWSIWIYSLSISCGIQYRVVVLFEVQFGSNKVRVLADFLGISFSPYLFECHGIVSWLKVDFRCQVISLVVAFAVIMWIYLWAGDWNLWDIFARRRQMHWLKLRSVVIQFWYCFSWGTEASAWDVRFTTAFWVLLLLLC